MDKRTNTLSRMREWRTSKGYSLQEVSDLTGVSISMLSLAERGQRNFSPETKVLIARRLGVPVGKLFDPDDVDVEAEAS